MERVKEKRKNKEKFHTFTPFMNELNCFWKKKKCMWEWKSRKKSINEWESGSSCGNFSIKSSTKSIINFEAIKIGFTAFPPPETISLSLENFYASENFNLCGNASISHPYAPLESLFLSQLSLSFLEFISELMNNFHFHCQDICEIVKFDIRTATSFIKKRFSWPEHRMKIIN